MARQLIGINRAANYSSGRSTEILNQVINPNSGNSITLKTKPYGWHAKCLALKLNVFVTKASNAVVPLVGVVDKDKLERGIQILSVIYSNCCEIVGCKLTLYAPNRYLLLHFYSNSVKSFGLCVSRYVCPLLCTLCN